ncbi:MAG: hypothetical protein WAQ08_19730 [Aquabacterium sp.]|jgi:hypothetical protein|uniref:hypothetical protein n=1 Tax=Aquabacterium sp. TaxID=1872578 RepID=UPI003BB0C18C
MAKALAAFEKAEKGTPIAALEALAEVEKQSVVLGKSAKGDKPLSAWLAELEKTIARRRKDLDKPRDESEAAQKSKGKGDGAGDDEEEGAAGLLLDPKRLLAQLTLLKRDPERWANFAFVDAGDRREAVLALSPKLAGRKMFTLIQQATGVKVGAYGTAWLDGLVLVLQLDKPFSGLVKKVRGPVRDCGFRITKVVLWDASGAVLEESAEEADDKGADQAPEASAPLQGKPSADDLATQFEQRLCALAKPLQAALVGAHPSATKLRELASVAREKAQAGQHAVALQALEALHKLLQTSPQPKGSGTASPPAQAQAPGAGKAAPVEYARCGKAWAATQTKVADEIKSLRGAILAEYRATPLFEAVSARIDRLDAVVQRFDEGLASVLKQADAAVDEQERARLHQAAAASTRRMLSRLDTDPVLSRLKDNPFVPIDPRVALNTTLQVLARQVA